MLIEGSTMTVDGNVYLAYAGLADTFGELGVFDGSHFTVTGDLEVGDGRTGVMTIGPGGLVDSSGVGSSGRDVIGDDISSGHGTVVVHGDGAGVAANWETDTLVVGEYGQGLLAIELGGEVHSTSAFIAAESASTGQVTVQDPGSLWIVDNFLYVGGDGTSGGGAGTLTVQNEGRVEAHGTLRIWNGSTVELRGSEIDTESMVIDPGGTFTHDNGRLTIRGGTLVPGAASYTIDGASPADLPVLRCLGGASTLGGGDTLTIGDAHRGAFEIGDGAHITTNIAIIADDVTSTGGSSVLVAGANSAWTIWGVLNVGNGGTGLLEIADGGLVEITSPTISSGVAVGGLASGAGEIIIRGKDSRLTTLHGIVVGTGGAGQLRIEGGGSLANPRSANWEGIASGPLATGNVEIVGRAADGTPSTWDSGASLLAVGVGGRGTLTVTDGGVMNLPFGDAAIGRWTGSDGSSAVVAGIDSAWNIGGSLYVGGDVSTAGDTATLTVQDGGFVNVGVAGSGLLRVYSTGTVHLNAGSRIEADTVELASGAATNFHTQPESTLQVNRLAGFGPHPVFNGSLTLGSHYGPNLGQITVAGGESLTADSILVGGNPLNPATFNVASGGVVATTGPGGMALIPTGRLTGAGEVVTPALENGGVVAPGNSAGELVVDGNYGQLATGMLEIEIGGVNPGLEYDTLWVTGGASLDGILNVSLIDPLGGNNIFMPKAGNSFEILTAIGGLGGTTFATVPADLPALTGALRWDIVYGSDFVRLDVLTPFTADFDRDGDVDGNDLSQWHGDFGGVGSDADGDGDSDGGDFLAWQRQYGSGVPVVPAGKAVPEPASLVLVLLAVLGLSRFRRLDMLNSR
jgi:T5SS/PEP-CTERM-associated repeat protein